MKTDWKKLLSRLNKVQNKIFAPFVIVMVVVGALIIYVMTDVVSTNVETRVNEKLDNDTRMIQQIVAELEKSLAFYAQFIADTEKVASHISEARDSRLVLIYLLEFLRENKISSDIGGGNLLSGNPKLNRLGMLGIRTTGLLSETQEGRTTLSLAAVTPVEGHTGSRSVVTVSRRMNREFLQEIKQKIGASRVQIYYKGQLIESSSDDQQCDEKVREILTPAFIDWLLAQETSHVEQIEYGGHSVKMKVIPLSINFQKQALVAVFESMDDLVRARSRIVMTTVLVVGLLLLVVVPIIILTVSRTVAPLQELQQASKGVAEGKLDQYVPVRTGDEVGVLSASFNKMIDDLRRYREDIERWNQTLEQRVAERSRQLAETQAKLIQSSKLAAVGELAAGIAHELNNPLAGIYAFLQVFAKTLRARSLRDLTDEEAREFQENLVHVEREIQRCKSTIGSLLAFARASEKQFVIVNINKVIRDILAFTQANIEKGNIKVESRFADDLPAVKADPNELQQVFLNIIVNARNAMPDGGELIIETNSTDDDRTVRASFSDTGEGIEEDIIDKIFDPFFTTREPGEGTGLGLSISYGIIKDHSGEIVVDSCPGKGTTFSVILPVADEESLDLASTSGDRGNTAKRKN